jgi:hypothetical protein
VLYQTSDLGLGLLNRATAVGRPDR